MTNDFKNPYASPLASSANAPASSPGMFSVACDCGRVLPVTASMCGQIIHCTCGATVTVPRLSELRRAAGLEGLSLGVINRIRTLYADGLLPTELNCVICDRRTDSTIEYCIECERPRAKGPGAVGHFFLVVLFAIIFPVWVLIRLRRKYWNPEIIGEEIVVNAPLRICHDCAASTKLSQGKLRSLYLQSKTYRPVLEKYPAACFHRISDK